MGLVCERYTLCLFSKLSCLLILYVWWVIYYYSCVFNCGGNCCGFCGATRSEEGDCRFRQSINNHLHLGLHHFHKCNLIRSAIFHSFSQFSFSSSIISFFFFFLFKINFDQTGGVGISNMTKKIQHHENMGFESLCKYRV